MECGRTREKDEDGVPSPKRRRSDNNHPSTSGSLLHPAPSHPRRHSDTSILSNDNGKGKAKVRSALEGFDDREEEDASGKAEKSPECHEPSNLEDEQQHDEDDDGPDSCAICLAPIVNKAVITPCHHSLFCFGCIRPWSDQSRKCPLCLGPITNLLYNIRSDKDYQTFHLLPLHIASSSSAAADANRHRSSGSGSLRNPPLPRHALYGRRGQDEATWREKQEERAIERRRYVYREGLYAKHVASNRYTGFKPVTPALFASNAALKARTLKFIRRELQIFPSVDISFLTTYILSIASQLDLRSASAIRLISDFLTEEQATHLVHEIDTFARSPFLTLEGYDRCIQYGRPERMSAEEEKARISGRLEPIVPAKSREPESDKRNKGVGGRRDSLPPRTQHIDRDGRFEQPRYERGRNYSGGSRRGAVNEVFDNNRPRYRSPPRNYERRRSPSPRASRHSSLGGMSQSRSHRHQSRSRSKEPRHREHSPSYSPLPSHRPSLSPPPRLLRSLSPSPKRSRTPSPQRPPTPPPRSQDEGDESDVISFNRGPDLDIPFNQTPRPLSPTNPPPEVFSIYGAAKRGGEGGLAAKLASTSQISTHRPESEKGTPPAALKDPSALKAKLQERLMAEYRAALSAKSSTASSPKPSLRSLLHTRLAAVKSESALRQAMGVAERYGNEDDEEVAGVTTFSAETKALLLARLEEEKRAMELESLTPPSPSLGSAATGEIKIGREEALRKALAKRKTGERVVLPLPPSVTTEATALEKKAEALRQKLKERSKIKNS